jgi:hypothetical protein
MAEQNLINETSKEATTNVVKKKGGCGKYVFYTLTILLLALGGYVYWKYFATFSDGLQGGKMQKISRKGNIFKTWEGYILINPSTDINSSAITSREWPFTVTNDSLAHVLESFAEKSVILRYHQKNGTLPWQGDTEYIIYDAQLTK